MTNVVQGRARSGLSLAIVLALVIMAGVMGVNSAEAQQAQERKISTETQSYFNSNYQYSIYGGTGRQLSVRVNEGASGNTLFVTKVRIQLRNGAQINGPLLLGKNNSQRIDRRVNGGNSCTPESGFRSCVEFTLSDPLDLWAGNDVFTGFKSNNGVKSNFKVDFFGYTESEIEPEPEPEPLEEYEWNRQVNKGQLTMRSKEASQGEDGRTTTSILIERSNDSSTSLTVKSYVIVRPQFQNGFDIDGGQEAVLRVYDRNGRVVYEQKGRPGSGSFKPTDPVNPQRLPNGKMGNQWGGLIIDLDRDIQLPPGGKITVEAGVHKPASGTPIEDANVNSMIGPGILSWQMDLDYPTDSSWVNASVPNPDMPRRCGLRIAIVSDQSSSLDRGDENGWQASRRAARSMVGALEGTSTEIGIYSFAGTAPALHRDVNTGQVSKIGTTATGNGPDFRDVNDDDGLRDIYKAVDEWELNAGIGNLSREEQNKLPNLTTNWAEGLKQLESNDYDAVYFITDGIPTSDPETQSQPGINQSFLKERSLNLAIDAANELKRKGTRVVPIMVRQTTRANTFATEDVALKQIRNFSSSNQVEAAGAIREGDLRYRGGRTASDDEIAPALYKYGSDAGSVFVFKEAVAAGEYRVDLYRDGQWVDVTENPEIWSYGTRTYEQMAKDISGEDAPILIDNFSELASQVEAFGQELANLCRGAIQVKKQIVEAGPDGQVRVVDDAAGGWEFNATAGDRVLREGDNDLVRSSTRITPNDGRGKGVVQWDIRSQQAQRVNIKETQQEGFSLLPQDGQNAKCTQTLNGRTTPLDVTNDGATGFNVNVTENDLKLAFVSCTVTNTKGVPKQGRVKLEKATYDPSGEVKILQGLGGAKFEVYSDPELNNQVAVIEPGQTSFDVNNTGTYYLVEVRSPQGHNLLAQPARFDIVTDAPNGEYRISAEGPLLKTRGEGNDMVLVVQDTKTGKLPRTGGLGVAVWALAGVVLLGAAAWLARGRRK